MAECPHGMLDEAWCSFCAHPEKLEPHVSQCHACGGEVMWVLTDAKRKSMPIDVEPGGDPKHARFRKERTERDGPKVVGVVHFVKDSELEANTKPLYCCHFDTCQKRKAGT